MADNDTPFETVPTILGMATMAIEDLQDLVGDATPDNTSDAQRAAVIDHVTAAGQHLYDALRVLDWHPETGLDEEEDDAPRE